MILGIDARTLYHARTGITRYLESFLQLWEESGMEGQCRLYLPRHRRVQTKMAESHRIKFCYYAEHCPEWFAFHFLLPRRLKKDGVEVFWGIQHELPLLLRRCFTGKVFLTIHDLSLFRLPQTMRFRGFLRSALKKWAFRKSCMLADQIIGISEATCSDLKQLFPFVQNKLTKIFSFFLQSNVPPVRPKNLEGPGNARFFLSVGALQPRKNLLRAFRAFAELGHPPPHPCGGHPLPSRACPPACPAEAREAREGEGGGCLYYVVVASDRWGNQEIHRWLQSTPHKNRFLFLQETSEGELAWLYQNAVALIYPSLLEGFGYPVLEAFSYGCPVLTSNCSSLPEVGGELAIYADPYSVDDIAKGMKDLSEDAVWKHRVKENSAAWLQMFDGHISFEQFRRLLEKP